MADDSFTHGTLIEWSKDLQSWQRDGLRRILTSGALTADDVEEVLKLAKRADGKEPIPADASHVHEKSPNAPPVRVLKLSDISRVNALSKGPLNFAPDGLTVVYGDNA